MCIHDENKLTPTLSPLSDLPKSSMTLACVLNTAPFYLDLNQGDKTYL